MPAVPEPLRRAYELMAGAELPVASLLDPSQIVEEDGRLVFYIDGAEGHVWSQAADGSIWMSRNEDGADWQPASPDLATFVVQMLVMNAALDPGDGRYGAYSSYLPAGGLAGYRPLDLPSWPDPSRWFATETAVAFAAPAGDGLMAWVAALDPAGLPDGDDWDYVAIRDD